VSGSFSVKFQDLTFISYDSGIPGYVTSEWVDDKLHSLRHSDIPVTLITHPKSLLRSSKNLRVFKPFSFGWTDFSREQNEETKKFSVGFFLVWLLANSAGRVFDFVFEKLAGAYSWGKWSWILLTFPVALATTARSKSRVVFSTGGPSSAHFVGLLVKLCVPKSKLYVELQDPFIGTEMGLSPRSKRVMEFLERALVKHSTKVVFVTEVAASRARNRYKEPWAKEKIQAIYPGSRDFGIRPEVASKTNNGKVVFMHLGSLYTSRNLDLLFRAMDELKKSSVDLAERIQVVNQGEVSVLNAEEYRNRDDFEQLPVLGREEALGKAKQADFLLLVQHSDSRSEETIPYKTYDYLNLGVPIFGLTNNPELDTLIASHGGFVGSSNDLAKTLEALRLALSSYVSGPHGEVTGNKISIGSQFLKIFE
jgi:glycosyltransferase involved in cell wall biosynthesis